MSPLSHQPIVRGIARRRRGKTFAYVADDGRPVRDPATRARIRALAIPPAWTDVVISTSPDAHLQATGRDARGRKQYRYHRRWRLARDAAKFERVVAFCHVLPRVRRAVTRALRTRGLGKPKVIAALLALLESCQLRVGNDEYARANGSYGATTLEDKHARPHGDHIHLVYRGKSGVVRNVRVDDRRLVAIVRACRALPGKRLFQYVEGGARPRAVTSADVNAFLRAITRGPFTAKDYRTWAATMSAAALLALAPPPESKTAAKRAARRVIESVAQRLGHTPTVCRASYVHPRILDDFTTGRLAGALGARVRRACARATEADHLTVRALRAVEPAVAAYLARRPIRA